VKRLIGTLVGALVGAFLGAGMGIVGAFGGISGLTVFTIIGAFIGFLAVPDIQKIGSRFGNLRGQNKNKCS
jgi:predicted lipid-binding transport protein (Tim44 family)